MISITTHSITIFPDKGWFLVDSVECRCYMLHINKAGK